MTLQLPPREILSNPPPLAKRGNAVDHSGKRYGRLTVINQAGKSSDGHLLWKCLCNCGILCVVQSNKFRNGTAKGTQSCGCLRSEVSKQRAKPWNANLTYQNHGAEQVYKHKKAWAAAVRRVKGNSCQICGWDKARCDVHHLLRKSRGGLNTISKGQVICPNCHRQVHEAGL